MTIAAATIAGMAAAELTRLVTTPPEPVKVVVMGCDHGHGEEHADAAAPRTAE